MQIKGTFKQFIFKSDAGYVIGLFKIKEAPKEMHDYLSKTITITGYFADINENENYILEGETVNHPKYGFQFNVLESSKIKPEDKDGIVEFLSSGLFKGVGEKLALKIVDTLGDDALTLILEDMNNLMRVPKISYKKALAIYETLCKYDESHKIIVYLNEIGFSNKEALLIYNVYKDNTLRIIENNIYRLLDDIKELSFSKIDKIGLSLNIKELDDRRIEALIFYIMKDLTYKNGDTYLKFEEIKSELIHYLSVTIDDKTILELINNLVSDMKVIIYNDDIYLYEIYEAEYNIVTKVNNLLSHKKNKYENIDKLINDYGELYNITYNDEQKLAIKKALENNITIITGGPGVGKTTIIRTIVEIYKLLNKYNDDKLNEKVALLAPTGRASKRISESTNYKALTIHRFLKWNKETDEFMVNEYNKDFSHLIIIDEASMVDINLLNSLFLGILDNVKLVLVGDFNQLPSVGPGNVLKDMIESGVIDTIKLEKLYRQSEDSYIPDLAQEIKDNNLTNYLHRYDDYMFLNCESDDIVPKLVTLCKQLMEKGYNYLNTQIMAPMYAGYTGIDHLNSVLQNVFNPSDNDKKEIKYGDIIFRVNDKVLELQNNPDLGIFNGDIGTIIDIVDSLSTKGSKDILVDFYGNIVRLKTKDLANLKHGYVISIHKSQGSEFKLVVILVDHHYKRLLYRKLIYTGVTRAKEKLIIIGESDAFLNGVDNQNEYLRKTNLKNRLIESINNK